jgi:MSHA biogenesis protein MshI
LAAKFRRSSSGNTVVVADSSGVRYAHAEPAKGKRPLIASYGEAPAGDGQEALAAALKSLGVAGTKNGLTLLPPQDYQFVAVDAPEVPEAELKSAMKWRLKDIIGYPVEEATFDLLPIPIPAAAASRTRSIFSVVAKSQQLLRRVLDFDYARFGIAVIDIPETAQRNVAALFEEEGRGVAWLYFDESGGLMTITCNGELYHARRFDITAATIEAASGVVRDDLFNRILLELQRTIDNFERQFSSIALTKVLVGPEREESGLAEFLKSNLAIGVDAVSLESVLDFAPGTMPGREAQWRFFHVFGCALRSAGPFQ